MLGIFHPIAKIPPKCITPMVSSLSTPKHFWYLIWDPGQIFDTVKNGERQQTHERIGHNAAAAGWGGGKAS